ncbi:MAG: cytochrome c [Deltaproteobacteria bacterium]|nr:cytochrome c [Deltaproteobacteria bacterium]
MRRRRRRVIAAALVAALAVVPGAASAADADALAVHDYLLSCGGCHGLDGAGSARVPSLRGIDHLLARPGGRAYVLRVPGVASAPLPDVRLAALLDWIFVNFQNRTAAAFRASEVAAARATPLVDPKAARAALERPPG